MISTSPVSVNWFDTWDRKALFCPSKAVLPNLHFSYGIGLMCCLSPHMHHILILREWFPLEVSCLLTAVCIDVVISSFPDYHRRWSYCTNHHKIHISWITSHSHGSLVLGTCWMPLAVISSVCFCLYCMSLMMYCTLIAAADVGVEQMSLNTVSKCPFCHNDNSRSNKYLPFYDITLQMQFEFLKWLSGLIKNSLKINDVRWLWLCMCESP